MDAKASTPIRSEEQQALSLPDAPGIEAGWEILTVSEDRARGKFTADQLAANESKRASVLRMLGQGLGISATARAHGMSRNTVLAAARRWAGQIEQEKQRLGAECFDVARLAVERMRDEMAEMPKASLPIIAGVMIDKGQLLSGAPTVRVEHIEAGAASFNDWLSSVVDVTAQPVAEGQIVGQNDPRPAATALPAEDAPAAPSRASCGEMLSPVLSPSLEGAGAGETMAGQMEPLA